MSSSYLKVLEEIGWRRCRFFMATTTLSSFQENTKSQRKLSKYLKSKNLSKSNSKVEYFR